MNSSKLLMRGALGRWNTFASTGGIPDHSALLGLQGGTAGEHYHMTSAQIAALHSAISLGTANGLSLVGQVLSLPTTANPAFAGLTLANSPIPEVRNETWMPWGLTANTDMSWSDMGTQFAESGIRSLVYLGEGICLAGTYGNGKILRSTDGGKTWEDLGTQFGQVDIRKFCYLGNGIVLAGTGNTTGKILRSIDYGKTWVDLGTQYSQTYILSFVYLGNGVVLAGSNPDGKILRSTNYGFTWVDLGTQAGETAYDSLIYLGRGIVVGGSYPHGKIIRSTDNGLTWTDLGTQFGQVAIDSMIYLGNGIALAGTGDVTGKILRSTDDGLTWFDMGTQFGQKSIRAQSYLGNGIILAGTYGNAGGTIIRSIDWGLTWTDLGQQFSQGYILSLAYLGDGLVLAGSGLVTGKILRLCLQTDLNVAQPTFAGLTVDTNTLFVNPATHYVGVGTLTPGYQVTAGRGYLSIIGSSLAGVLELATAEADADAKILGMVQWTDKNNTLASKLRSAIICKLSGTTANARGAELQFFTQEDNVSNVALRALISRTGNLIVGKISGTLGSQLIESAGKVRADTGFDCNGTAGVTQTAGSPSSLTTKGGIVTAVTVGGVPVFSGLNILQPIVTPGTVTTNGTTTLAGNGTTFLTTFSVGSVIAVAGESARKIVTVTSDTVLVVDVAFSSSAGGLTYTHSVNQFVFLPSGNVGFGTETPGACLEIYGAARYVKFNDGTASGGFGHYIGGAKGPYGFFIGAISNHGLTLRTNNQGRLVVMSDGKVGIGNIAPNEILDVSGTIRTSVAFNVNGSAGLSTTLTLDDGANWRITMTFSGGILTAKTTAASSGQCATWS